ncbi:MAG: hypothetical protein ACXVLZ_05525 [Acidimicrobiia bacterium]
MRPFERLRYLARATGEDDEVLLEEAADCLAGFADDPMGVVIACRRLLAYHPRSTLLWWLCARVLAAPDPADGAWAAWRDWRADPTPNRLAGALPFPHEQVVATLGWPDVIRDGLAERIDLDLVAVSNRADDTFLSRRLRASVQPVRVVDETELLVVAPSHLLVTPVATGGGRILVAPGTDAIAAAARDGGASVWLIVPRGIALPGRLLEARDRAVAGAGDGEDDDADRPVADWTGPPFDVVVGPDGVGDQSALAHRADCAPAPELLRLG